MTEYLGDESATVKAIRADGWFYTGDTGYVKDGRVDIVGNIKDIIKVDGFAVSPTELEDTLHECPGVSDCDASGKGYGVDEHSLPSIVAADDTLSVNRFRKHLHSNLSSHKTDQCEVHFVESIPRNRGGKTLCETNSSKELSKLKVHNLIIMEPQISARSSIRKYQVSDHFFISLQATLPKMLFFLQKAPGTVCRLSFAALTQGYHGCRRLTNCAGYAYMRATVSDLHSARRTASYIQSIIHLGCRLTSPRIVESAVHVQRQPLEMDGFDGHSPPFSLGFESRSILPMWNRSFIACMDHPLIIVLRLTMSPMVFCCFQLHART